ncbi:MAG TPA: histidine kinase, partial [Erythrobacter sp.]|nr:histidine kinase [Erythrobacter sp.]
MHDIPTERQIEILTARLERSERALRDAETALEKRMTELFRANQDLSLRETELARRLEVESALLLGALSTIQMATLYGERERGFSFSASAASLFGLPPGEEMTIDKVEAVLHPLDQRRIMRETS